jgi:hypothetical protein
MKYHDLLDCARENLPVAIADHGEMESASMDELARCLSVMGVPETVLIGCKTLSTPLRF